MSEPILRYNEPCLIDSAMVQWVEDRAVVQRTEANSPITPMASLTLPAYSESSLLSYKMGNIGFIQVSGMIIPEGDRWDVRWGDAPLNVIREEATALDNDPTISKIVYVYSTPGGVARSLSDMWAFIQGQTKQTVAYVQGQMASAGYFIGSAHSKIIASDMALIGSIGTMFTLRNNDNKETTTIVSEQSPKKVNHTESIQQAANDLTTVFISYVAKGRNVTPEKVLSDFGQGSVMIASRALEAGMIDKVQLWDKFLSSMGIKEDKKKTSDFDTLLKKINNNTPQGESMKEGRMLNEFKASNPELYAACFEAGKQEAVRQAAEMSQKESARVESLNALISEMGTDVKPKAKAAASAVIASAIANQEMTASAVRGDMFKAAFSAKEEAVAPVIAPVAPAVASHGEMSAAISAAMGNLSPEGNAIVTSEGSVASALAQSYDSLEKRGLIKK